MTTTLTVSDRSPEETAAAIRAAGRVPAVVYGTKQPALSISVDSKQFTNVLKAAGESTIIVLEGLEEPIEVLIKEVTYDPVKPHITHADLYAFERGKAMSTEVPLDFTGEAPASKLGAVINKVYHEVRVTCRPSDLPSHIDVDLGQLTNLEDRITVADLVLPPGVTVEWELDVVLAIAAEPVQEEASADTELDMESIAVEEKGKQPTEGATS